MKAIDLTAMICALILAQFIHAPQIFAQAQGSKPVVAQDPGHSSHSSKKAKIKAVKKDRVPKTDVYIDLGMGVMILHDQFEDVFGARDKKPIFTDLQLGVNFSRESSIDFVFDYLLFYNNSLGEMYLNFTALDWREKLWTYGSHLQEFSVYAKFGMGMAFEDHDDEDVGYEGWGLQMGLGLILEVYLSNDLSLRMFMENNSNWISISSDEYDRSMAGWINNYLFGLGVGF